jgi:hypothetical protein
MQVQEIERVKHISREGFRSHYLIPGKPVIIEDIAKQWPAYEKWTWEYFKEIAGSIEVPVYNNSRAGAKVPVNGWDDKMKFADYIDMISKGDCEWRIFLFNLFRHAPFLKKDFEYPSLLIKGFVKAFPMLFVGGAGSIAHMHYDIDLSHIFHTQFIGRKRVLLLDQNQNQLIYKMPGTVESAASFVHWEQGLDYERFPALEYAEGYTAILEHGDTLYMPGGYWHHMQYMESGFAMSLRAMPTGISGKLDGLYHLAVMRHFNNMLIRLSPEWWYQYKRDKAKKAAELAMLNRFHPEI